MLLKAYSIRDTKAEVFNAPFWQKTHGEAERNFMELVNDKNSMVSKYPEDYDLYYLGDYDDLTGKIIALESPTHIVKAIHMVRQAQPRPMSLPGAQALIEATQQTSGPQ